VGLPKLVVVVEEDDAGKMWNYVFTEEEWLRSRAMFMQRGSFVHLAEPFEKVQTAPLTLQAEVKDESVMIGVLPRSTGEAVKASHPRVRPRSR
jgi:hypothetical protein